MRGTSIFTTANVAAITETAKALPQKSPVWIAEALNDATEAYFTEFAMSRSGRPSEQEQWVRELRVAADTCLRMLVPNSDGARPRFTDHRVHSALFHLGQPVGIKAVAGPADDFDYDPIRDALDDVSGKLWDLRRMAEYAEAQWRSETTPREDRRQIDKPVLSWVSNLADVYERVFDTAAPSSPKASSPFVRFANAARLIALGATVTEHGTDDEARERLGKLTPERFASFVRERREGLFRRLKKARKAKYIPTRIALGVVHDATTRLENQRTNKI